MELPDEYVPVYDEEYGDLFKNYIFNISDIDLLFNVSTFNNTFETKTQSDDFDWSMLQIVTSGIGILANSILLLFLAVDVIIDKTIRRWARHALLSNISVLHVILLILYLTQNIQQWSSQTSAFMRCKVMIHLIKATEFSAILGTVLIVWNVFLHVFDPRALAGLKQCYFWSILIPLSWCLGHFVTYFCHTEYAFPTKVELPDKTTEICVVDMKTEVEYIAIVVMFFIPFCLSLLVSFVSVIGLALNMRSGAPYSDTTELPRNNQQRRKWAAIFVFTFSLLGFLMRLPVYQFQVRDLVSVLSKTVGWKNVYFVFNIAMIVYLFFLGLLPLVSLLLLEIRTVYSKAVRKQPEPKSSASGSVETQM